MTKLQRVIFHSTISYPKKNHEEDKRGRQVMSCHSDLESLLKILYLPWIWKETKPKFGNVSVKISARATGQGLQSSWFKGTGPVYKERCNYMDRPALNRQSSKCTASGWGRGGLSPEGGWGWGGDILLWPQWPASELCLAGSLSPSQVSPDPQLKTI